MEFKILKEYTNIAHYVSEKDKSKKYQNSMALHTGEERSAIIENRRTVMLDEMRGITALHMLQQTHSSKVVVVDAVGEQWSTIDDPIEADAHITNARGVALGIMTADCVPILLYDKNHGVVGAVHAGWKGTRDKILTKTVEKMNIEYGVEPSGILACIGPAIGGCCYEVGEDVSGGFSSHKIPSENSGKTMLDLKSINRDLLIEAGVLEENIEISDICTSCQKDRFFSYRAERGCSGRFMSVIGLKA